MKNPSKRAESNGITPAVHLEFIQNQLENPKGSGAEEIEQYHRALFLHHHAEEWEKCRQIARTHEDRVAFLEGQLKDTEAQLGQRTKFVPVTVDGEPDSRPNTPWNAWDVAMFVACGLGIVALITFGVWNISFNLLESGLVTFRQNPIRSYLWAALLPVGALAVKIGWDFLQDKVKRDVYLGTCLTVGLIGVFVWVAAYACVYPTLSKGIDEHIAALTVFDDPASQASAGKHLNFAGAKWIDFVTVSGQAIAEIFLSAVLGVYLTTLYARHRPVRLAYDPAYRQLSNERRSVADDIARERTRLGEANGSMLRLENQLAALIAYGKSMFHKEAATRQDQSEKRQVILDQLSDHLRGHLDTVASGNRLASNSGRTVLNGNGG